MMESTGKKSLPSFGRQNRSSKPLKGKILGAARRVFGEYGFHGATTRMIARAAGVDISTLHYHWGEKAELYEAVILDITGKFRSKLIEVEKVIHGLPLAERMDIAIEMVTDYLFRHPEVSNIVLFRYFGKTRHPSTVDFHVPVFISDIAHSMNLCTDEVSPIASMQVLAMMNLIFNFISGEAFFRSTMNLKKADYVSMVKATAKLILIPAFAGEIQRSAGPLAAVGRPV
jgi:AcrR family transcriptional regulator